MNEAFRVVCPGVLQGALALFEDLQGAAVVLTGAIITLAP